MNRRKMTTRILVLFCLFVVTFPIFAVNIELADGIDNVTEAGKREMNKVEKAGKEKYNSIKNKDSRPLLDVSQLEIKNGEINWRRDWWRYMSLIISVLIALCLLTYVTKIVARVLGIVICLASGGLGAWLAGNVYLNSLKDLLPNSLTNAIPANYIFYIIGFLAGYTIGVFIFALLKKPVEKKSTTKKKK